MKEFKLISTFKLINHNALNLYEAFNNKIVLLFIVVIQQLIYCFCDDIFEDILYNNSICTFGYHKIIELRVHNLEYVCTCIQI